MPVVNLSLNMSALPSDVKIDDDDIAEWIEGRLNDTRNTFARNLRPAGSPKTGARYRRQRGGLIHQASAPGEYPAWDSGQLVNSVSFGMWDARTGSIYSSVEHADWLTTGTPHMAPRKMLDDALKEVLDRRPQKDKLAAAAKFEEK